MDSQIPLDVLYNLILTHENIRPAMLIQPINYSAVLLESILKYIGDYFPNLVLTREYHGYQGIIVSKREYSDQRISSKDMGKILGYPYYDHFDEITEDDSHVIEIIAIGTGSRTQILANVCNDIIKLPEFKQLAGNIEYILNKHSFEVTVHVIVTNIPSYSSVITELLSDRELSLDHVDFVNNQFWNYLTDGTSQEIPEVCTHLDYSNKIHRGILIAYLLDFKHDRLSILYPLKGTNKVHVDRMNKKLNDALVKVLQE